MGKEKQNRILLLDQDKECHYQLMRILPEPIYHIRQVASGREAIEILEVRDYDLLITEISLSDMDGIGVVHELRKSLKSPIRIIVLTTHKEEYTEVAAFNEGVDDYLIKPLKPVAFFKRVSKLLNPDVNVFSTRQGDKDIVLDPFSNSVSINNQPVRLPKKTFQLLLFLMNHKGTIFSREELIYHLWGNSLDSTSRTVDVHVRKIREKLGNDFITNLKGIGYMIS